MARIDPAPPNTFGGKDTNKYPLQNKIHVGYGVNPPTKYPKEANGKFINGRGQSIDLYVTDIELSLEMGGDVAQSAEVRQFFPNNLMQPTIEISGITPSSYHYNNLANFVRISHGVAVSGGDNPLVTFQLPERSGFPYEGNRPNGNQITKGRRRPIVAEGYLQSAMAGGRKENHAPEWQITMMVVIMRQGPWKDEVAQPSSLETWMNMFLDRPSSDFVQPPSERTPGKKPPKQKPKPRPRPGDPPKPGPLDPRDPLLY